ncbi:MAG: nitroreductase [Candidatus Thorarchaeota archaeon]|nr:nitroreductase [Candidatus Thorarchaeota archaeon]
MFRIPVEDWYSSIFKRYSQRKYSGGAVPIDTLDEFEMTVDAYRPLPGVRAVLIRNPAEKVFRGLIRSFIKVIDAPHYVAFVADKEEPHVQEASGYTGEGIILDATSRGMNTCWVGGFFRAEVVEGQVELGVCEQVIGVTPIGYAKEESRRIGLLARKRKRKPIESIVNVEDRTPPEWVAQALEAARLAPSAANRQPWEFAVKERQVILSTKGRSPGIGISKRLDCGIAMLHFELGALVNGVEGQWKFLEAPHVAEFIW